MSVSIEENPDIFNIIVNDAGDNIKVVINETNDTFNVIVNNDVHIISGSSGQTPYEYSLSHGFQGTEDQYIGLSTGQSYKTAGEVIPSYTPVVVINDIVYKLNNQNTTHQYSFYGFSLNGVSIGENCLIQDRGDVVFMGWGLIPNTSYLAGPSGIIITQNNTNGFTKIIGTAINPNTMRIIKDYTPINKI